MLVVVLITVSERGREEEREKGRKETLMNKKIGWNEMHKINAAIQIFFHHEANTNSDWK